MKKSCRFLAVILAFVMTVSTLAVLMTAVHADDSNIASDKATIIKAFDTAELATHTARQFTEGTPIGIRMGFGAPFNKFTPIVLPRPTSSASKTPLEMGE